MDDALIRMNSADIISELGHEVLEAVSGEDALELATTRSFDVLVADLGLPGISGQELSSRMADLRPGVAIVIASGEGTLTPMQGVEALLVRKPYSQEDLRQALARVRTRTRPTT